ncbi:MAG: hypothetical protein K0M50_14780 [Prolixibacteraceae bacterium]|nr:hypothetical protein [Prolixibacteraceae bacterium]
MPAANIMYKTLGFRWLFEVFCPASAFATADSDEARNPQCFIHVSVATVDKFGLKQIHLNKHKRDVAVFYSKIISKPFESELAISYQKRLTKYREKIFLFIENDNIPWNNNNAEHSIKPFAKWRKKISKNLTKQNIENHLILLSILQTCRYQGINFFEFLKSGELSIFEFQEKRK